MTAHAAKAMGVDVVTFFMGSPIWKYWYSFPQTSEQMIEEGYQKVKELWSPIMDEFDKCGVKLALEVHPTEIAFDYWSTKKLLDVFEHRPTLGINFDPSHLIWQGLDPAEMSGASDGQMNGSAGTGQNTGMTAQVQQDNRININTADEAQLTTLTGIGATRAQAIIAYREENGPFAAIEDIMNVQGIKEGTFAKIKDEIVVG